MVTVRWGGAPDPPPGPRAARKNAPDSHRALARAEDGGPPTLPHRNCEAGLAVRILGISAFYHDRAAALIEDGRIVAAAQEERFTRIKHDSAFPENAIASCLHCAGMGLRGVDETVFYEKPLPKFERLIETYLRFAPCGFASFRASLPVWIKQKL